MTVTWTNPTDLPYNTLYDATEEAIRVNDLQWLYNTRWEMLYYDHTRTTFNNDNATHAVATASIPGGTLGTNNIIYFDLWGGIVTTSANANNGTLTLSYGGTNLCTGQPTTFGANNHDVSWHFWGSLMGDGATNAQRLIAHFFGISQAVGTTVGGWPNASLDNTWGVSTVDSTASQNLIFSIAQSRANADSTLRYHTCYIYRPAV